MYVYRCKPASQRFGSDRAPISYYIRPLVVTFGLYESLICTRDGTEAIEPEKMDRKPYRGILNPQRLRK